MLVTAERIAAVFRIRWMSEINFTPRLLYTWGLGATSGVPLWIGRWLGHTACRERGNLPPLLGNKPRFLCSLAIRLLLHTVYPRI